MTRAHPAGPDQSHPDRSHPDRSRPDPARIDEVFGETLPTTTSDEVRDRDGRIGDDWWREQRPPHHG